MTRTKTISPRSAPARRNALKGLVMGLVVAAAPPLVADTIVYPTGSHPVDHTAIQAAVDGGGRVLLKAVNLAGEPTAFDFGPAEAGSGYVQLTTDVQIRGEKRKGAMTTIRGGEFPFRGYRRVRSRIEGIRFHAPFGGALHLEFSTGLDFSDNVITDVVGFPWFGNRKATGIWIIGGAADGVTGTVTIARNTIANLDGEDGIGLALVGFAADMRVLGNDIRGANFVGIFAFGHLGRVWIEGNRVIPGPERFPGIYSSGNGIQVGPTFASDFEGRPAGPALIRNNEVVCENPMADGILIFGAEKPLNNSVVVNNRVTMRDSFYGGITLADDVSNTVVIGNRVRGSGEYAIDVIAYFFPEVANRSNVLAANDVAPFAGNLADVYLDESTAESWVVGCHGTVVDLGTDNHVVGCSTANDQGAPSAGADRQADARARKLDVLRRLGALAHERRR